MKTEEVRFMRTTEETEKRVKSLTKAYEALEREESYSSDQMHFVAEVVMHEIARIIYPEGEDECETQAY